MALITVLSQSGTLPTAATIQGWLHAIRTAAPWPKTASGKFFRKRNSKLLEDADEGPIERPAESGVTNPPDRPRARAPTTQTCGRMPHPAQLALSPCFFLLVYY